MNLETLELFIENKVAVITLNRPPFNPLNMHLLLNLIK